MAEEDAPSKKHKEMEENAYDEIGSLPEKLSLPSSTPPPPSEEALAAPVQQEACLRSWSFLVDSVSLKTAPTEECPIASPPLPIIEESSKQAKAPELPEERPLSDSSESVTNSVSTTDTPSTELSSKRSSSADVIAATPSTVQASAFEFPPPPSLPLPQPEGIATEDPMSVPVPEDCKAFAEFLKLKEEFDILEKLGNGSYGTVLKCK